MPSSGDKPQAGLNKLIAQCRKVEAALSALDDREDPVASSAMHRFVADMDARRAPPGMWSPLVLAVLVMTGGLGVGIEVLSLLLQSAGAAWAAFALVVVCAGTALALAIGVVWVMAGRSAGLVVVKWLVLALVTIGALGLAVWMQGGVRAAGPVVALLGGLGAWLVVNSAAFYVFAGYRVALRATQRRKFPT
ncbi:hypothetical protein LP085_27910 [Achromobacter sp. MY14]|uniref:hypothetical protein n=1 Tax=unclassified Achromobacter TaxID=2626865 RepID=UPI001E57F8C8|nr:hypothetical protein [Achromobacter sp. MY14]MCD0500707.1 hypothetical protein [Achromobacter sp. MY14]